MSLRVIIPTPLRKFTAGAEQVEVEASTIKEVIDRLEAFRESGARTAVLRFAARDQLSQLEECAEALHHRGLLGHA